LRIEDSTLNLQLSTLNWFFSLDSGLFSSINVQHVFFRIILIVMSDPKDTELARLFGIHPDLVPHIPELLADLWSMGVPTDVIVDLFRPLSLPGRSTRVLDLGCGKGAVAIELARELDFSVIGIDLYPPFIEDARSRAAGKGVEGNCRFILGDIREVTETPDDFHAATLVWVGEALGDLENSVGRLRNQVLPGGYMVISSGYRKPGTDADLGHVNFVDSDKARRQITAHNDVILEEIAIPGDRMGALYEDYLDSLRKGAQRISASHPEFEEKLNDHVDAQKRMCDTMTAAVVTAVWLLWRNPSGSESRPGPLPSDS